MANLLPMSIGPLRLEGELRLVDPLHGIVVFAHGCGSSRRSWRNRQLAETLQHKGLGTLLFDLLTDEEAMGSAIPVDVPLLAQRVTDAIDELSSLLSLPIGLFGAGAGAAAALVAAAHRPKIVHAVVSRGGHPDLAGELLNDVGAPTLLIVGAEDTGVLAANRAALDRMRCERRLEIVPRATHLFEEAGALDAVAILAGAWFLEHLRPPPEKRRAWR